MIIHDSKCIFIHIPKTGGQSIEVSLGLNIGDKFSQNKKWYDMSTMVGLNPTSGEYMQHFSISRILKEIPTIYDYKSFTFVRNPWDRVVSDYKWYGGLKDRVGTLEEFIINERVADKSHVIPQYKFIYDENNVQLVDYIGRFETLERDFYNICEQLNLDPDPLPHHNKTCSKKHYTEYYSNTTKDLVHEKYHKDIEYFNYRFND